MTDVVVKNYSMVLEFYYSTDDTVIVILAQDALFQFIR